MKHRSLVSIFVVMSIGKSSHIDVLVAEVKTFKGSHTEFITPAVVHSISRILYITHSH